MVQTSFAIPSIGTVISSPTRPATATTVWIELVVHDQVALRDLILIESPGQTLLGTVIEIERIAERPVSTAKGVHRRPTDQITCAKLEILSASDMRQRPPDGTAARFPRSDEVTEFLAEARRIPHPERVALGVIPLPDGFAPVPVDLRRVVGPIATSMLITGAAGSLKSTAGVLLLAGIQQATQGNCAIVLVNSKGSDFLFADYGRQQISTRLGIQPLGERDTAIYAALGYDEPPLLHDLSVFVPQTTEISWRSARPLSFPRTYPFTLSQDVAIRYACDPTDDEERALSIITKQCIEEAAGPFAQANELASLRELILALESEFVQMVSERARWRNQFQATTVAAALRQLRAAERDLGPILGEGNDPIALPVEWLAGGGTWVVDVAPMPQRAAQAVIDELVTVLWDAKARGVIPHDMPLVLLIDELNRWSSTGPTASRLAAIVRDQRHRRFSLIGLAQQLSTLHPQLLANADTLWIGSTRSQELAHDVYKHLPPHVHSHLHRLPQGQRVLDAWPMVQPLIVEVPFPNWLIADEGLLVVENQQALGIS